MAGVVAIVTYRTVEMAARQWHPSHSSRTETTSINMIIRNVSCWYTYINFRWNWECMLYTGIL